jgi:hypothetical protein
MQPPTTLQSSQQNMMSPIHAVRLHAVVAFTAAPPKGVTWESLLSIFGGFIDFAFAPFSISNLLLRNRITDKGNFTSELNSPVSRTVPLSMPAMTKFDFIQVGIRLSCKKNADVSEFSDPCYILQPYVKKSIQKLFCILGGNDDSRQS